MLRGVAASDRREDLVEDGSAGPTLVKYSTGAELLVVGTRDRGTPWVKSELSIAWIVNPVPCESHHRSHARRAMLRAVDTSQGACQGSLNTCDRTPVRWATLSRPGVGGCPREAEWGHCQTGGG